MKLIVSILALATLTSTAHAANCSATTEPLIGDLWNIKPQFTDEKKSTYGNALKRDLNAATFKGQKVRVSEATYKQYKKEGWVPAEAAYKTDALYGQRVEVKSSGGNTELLRTGYERKDDLYDRSNHYFVRADDVRITLDKSCKLASLEFLRPKPVKVLANDCINIAAYKIKDLEKNMNELRERVAQKFKTDGPTTDRIMMSCRQKVGTHYSPIVKILPIKSLNGTSPLPTPMNPVQRGL